jgi:hypothetical protein
MLERVDLPLTDRDLAAQDEVAELPAVEERRRAVLDLAGAVLQHSEALAHGWGAAA